MASQLGKYTMEIHADTRPFQRAIRKVGRQFWWAVYGPTITAIGVVVGFAAGFLVGIIRM